MIELEIYLKHLADSDLFGSFAIICLIVAFRGLSKKASQSKTHRMLTFLCLIFVPVLHGIGSYLLSQPPA